LARTEGVFTEPAGGTTIAVTRKLVRDGIIAADEATVICITGNGYKTSDAIADTLPPPAQLGRSLSEVDAFVADRDRRHREAGG
jgi:threonine synthase